MFAMGVYNIEHLGVKLGDKVRLNYTIQDSFEGFTLDTNEIYTVQNITDTGYVSLQQSDGSIKMVKGVIGLFTVV